MRSNRALKAWYREINTRFFENELTDNVCVRWAEEEDEEYDLASTDLADDGRHKYVILLNREKNTTRSIMLGSLIHEMVHVATELRDNHGSVFDGWRAVLAQRGIFKKGAVARRLTLF